MTLLLPESSDLVLSLDTIRVMDVLLFLRSLPDCSVNCIVTSPPYFGLRDYGVQGQIGLEKTPQEYTARMVEVFREARRVLRDDGVAWVNLGDSYANDDKWGGSTGGKHAKQLHRGTGLGRGKRETGLPPKSLIGIPWRVAFGLQDDGWILRMDVIWNKPNAMTESVKDRPSKSHEYAFLLAKTPHYWYDAEAIREPAKNWGPRDRSKGKYTSGNVPIAGGAHKGLKDGDFAKRGRNKRSVWTIPTRPFKGAHFATFPEELIEPMILAGCREGGVVLDPFMGSGTTALVARRLGRHYVGCELNPEYARIAEERLRKPFTKSLLNVKPAAEEKPPKTIELPKPTQESLL